MAPRGLRNGVRATIAQSCSIRSITDFGELPVFETAATFPMILVAQKGAVPNTCVFTKVKSPVSLYPNVAAIIRAEGKRLPADAFKESNWTLTDSDTADLFRKMIAAGTPLGLY